MEYDMDIYVTIEYRSCITITKYYISMAGILFITMLKIGGTIVWY